MAKKKKLNHKNHNLSGLKPFNTRTPEERKEIASKGGKASGKVRRAHRLLSDIYADFLANVHEIELYNTKGKLSIKKLSGERMIDAVVREILSDTRGSVQSARIALLRELREATEGSKVSFTNPDGSPMTMPQGIVITPIPTTKTSGK